MSRAPNIIVTIMDDQRGDALSCLGHPNIKTAHLDQLAQSGTCFTQAHNAGGNTAAICIPSRAMLHTGFSFKRFEGKAEELPTDMPTLGEKLQKNGYYTYGIGKWHNDVQSYARSFTDGAEIHFGGMGDPWNMPLCHFDPAGKYDCLNPVCHSPTTDNHYEYRHCDHIYPGKHISETLADASVEFLENYSQEKPYLLYVAFTAPHDPRLAPQTWHQHYQPESIRLPQNFLPCHPFNNGELMIRDELLAETPRKKSIIREHLADYYAMMSHADEQIGRIYQAMKKRDDSDNTVIVHTSDHGLALGSHGLMGKQNLYHHSLNVPLILSGPGIEKAQTDNRLCYGMDLHATLLEIAGIEPNPELDSRSLFAARRDELSFSYRDVQRAWRDCTWKIIQYNVNGEIGEQLFHLLNDPLETNDLSSLPKYRDTLTHCRMKLEESRLTHAHR